LNLWCKTETNFSTRQLFYLFALGLLAFSAYHLFSPWKLVIEIRLASDGSDTTSDRSIITLTPGQNGNHVKLTE
jgi:hypothetical protein